MVVALPNFICDSKKPKPVSIILNVNQIFSLIMLYCQAGGKLAHELKINYNSLIYPLLGASAVSQPRPPAVAARGRGAGQLRPLGHRAALSFTPLLCLLSLPSKVLPLCGRLMR